MLRRPLGFVMLGDNDKSSSYFEYNGDVQIKFQVNQPSNWDLQTIIDQVVNKHYENKLPVKLLETKVKHKLNDVKLISENN